MLNIKSLIKVLKSPTIYQFAIVGAGSLAALAITAILTSILGIFHAVSALIGLESSPPIVFFLNDR
jgi:putative flippase GtrA